MNTKRLAVAAALLVSSWFSGANAVELSVWAPAIYTPSSGFTPGANIHKNLYAQFQKENPGITLKYEVIESSPPGLQTILTAAGSKRFPDVAVIDGNWVARLVEANLLQPLDKYWSKEDQSDFHPAVIADETIGGKPYAIMFQTGMRGLFYRKSQLTAAGLDAFPRDWDALKASLPNFKKQSVVPILLPTKPNNEGNTVHLLSMFWGLGGELVDEKGAPIFFEGKNGEILERTFQLYRDLVTEFGMTPQSATMDEVAVRPYLYSGEALSIGQSSSTIRLIWGELPSSKDDLLVAPYPLPGGAEPVTVLGGFSYSIMTKDPAKLDAAWKFVAFMTRADNMGALNETLLHLPVRTSIWNDRPFFSTGPLMKTLRTIYDGKVRTRPSVPLYPVISTALSMGLSEVVSGSSTPAKAVERARDTVLIEYNRQKGR